MIILNEKINSSHWFNRILSMFLNDKLAFVSIIFLIFIVFLSILGPSLINESFIKTARAKGVKERAVIFKHGLRNGLLPVITVAGDQAAAIANGAVIVETIFGWPGIGKLMIDSILQRDFAVVQASILITAIVILSINIIIDIAYAILDPRIRHK